MSQNILPVLAIFLAAVCLALLKSWSDRRKVLRNVREIADKLAHILAEDTEEKVMSFTDTEEVKHLIRQINAVLEDRQRRKAEFIHTEMDSKRMLSNVSHDIKTPLTVILGYLEIMQMEENASPLIGKVQDKAGQVIRMMNQFFDLAKLESGDAPLEMERVNLNEACRRNILDFYQILQEREFEVDIKIPELSLFIYGNSGALDRILFNLISNAVRYGGDGKYLGISLGKEAEQAVIRVSDHGKGIAREHQVHIFDRLYTMEDSRNREIQGNGLGLTIVKSLVQKMGGSVGVESEPGQLTVFTVSLPLLKY